MSNLISVTIDGKTVQVPQGMNLVEAARQAGVDIPVFCYHQKLDPAGVCRMCLVQIEKMPKPVTACTTPCSDGMVVHTKTETVEQLRKGVLEFTLLNHPLDCPVCDKAGECDLQDQTFAYGAAGSRLHDGKLHKNKAVDLGPFIVLDEERCILCRRCVRFDDQVAQEQNLVLKERGVHNVVATTEGQPYDSYFSGNTIEFCPVGALTSEVYRFKARPWDLAKVDGVCTGCSVGCSVEQHYRFGRLLRLVGRETATSEGWLCDRGRFNHQYVNGETRVQAPLVKRDGKFVEVTWEEALREVAAGFRKALQEKGPAGVGVIGGGQLSLEEAYLLQKFARVTLGTGNIDHRVAGQLIASHQDYHGVAGDIDDATLVLVVDAVPGEQAPVLDLRIRKASERGKAKVVAVGTSLLHYRSRSKSIGAKPGQVAQVLLDHDFITRVVTEQKVVAVWDGRDAAVGIALFNVLGKVKAQGGSAHLLIIGEQANSRGAEYAGAHPGLLPGLVAASNTKAKQKFAQVWGKEVPVAGKDTSAMLVAASNGNLAAMYVVAANLLGTYPDGQLAQEALAKVPFLVVQDMFLTATAEMAHVVLPAASFAAKAGTYVSLDGQLATNQAAMPTEHQSRTDADIVAAVSAELGTALSAESAAVWGEMEQLIGYTPNTLLPGLAAEQVQAVLQQAAVEAAPGVAKQGDLLVVPIDRLFAGGSTALFDAGLARVRPSAAAYINPADAATYGLTEGVDVTLGNERGAMTLPVHLQPQVVPGTVQLCKGLPEAPANLLSGTKPAWVQITLRVKEVV